MFRGLQDFFLWIFWSGRLLYLRLKYWLLFGSED